MVEPGHEFDHGAMTLQATRDLEDRGAGESRLDLGPDRLRTR
jgi:hypothetical protein